MAIVKITLGLGLGGALGALLGYLGSCTSGACPLTATPWRGAFFGALTGLVMACALGQGCGTASRTVPNSNPPPEASSRTAAPPLAAPAGPAVAATSAKPREIADEVDFRARVLDSKGLVLVDFFATWCGYCQKLAPVLDVVAGQYAGRITFLKLNVDKQGALTKRFDVESLPTLVIFKDGKPVKTLVGFQPESDLKAVLDKLLTKP